MNNAPIATILAAQNPHPNFGYFHGLVPNLNVTGWVPKEQEDRVKSGRRLQGVKVAQNAMSPNKRVLVSKFNGGVCMTEVTPANGVIMCGMVFETQGSYWRHQRDIHVGAIDSPRAASISTHEAVAGELAMRKFVLTGGWRNALFTREPGYGPRTTAAAKIGPIADYYETRARTDEAFAKRWGRAFHREHGQPRYIEPFARMPKKQRTRVHLIRNEERNEENDEVPDDTDDEIAVIEVTKGTQGPRGEAALPIHQDIDQPPHQVPPVLPDLNPAPAVPMPSPLDHIYVPIDDQNKSSAPVDPSSEQSAIEEYPDDIEIKVEPENELMFHDRHNSSSASFLPDLIGAANDEFHNSAEQIIETGLTCGSGAGVDEDAGIGDTEDRSAAIAQEVNNNSATVKQHLKRKRELDIYMF